MRILYWTENYWPVVGGIEVLSVQLIAALRRRGHDIHVVTTLHAGTGEEDEFQGIPIHRIPFRAGFEGGDLRAFGEIRERILRIKESLKAEVVHVHSIGPSIFFEMQTQKRCPARTFLTSHGLNSPHHDKDSFLVKYLRTPDWISGVSRAALRDVLAIAPGARCPTSVVSNCLPPPDVEPSPLSLREPRLLCIGRLSREKGFDLAVRAFARVTARFSAARLTIAGDGPQKQDLVRLVHELRLEDRVEFRGWIAPERIYQFINEGSHVVVPSPEIEYFGLVALQAAQMARPVVATNVGGLPEVVADGETGRLVRGGDVDALASGMAELLSSPEAAIQMGRVGRRRAMEVFRFDRMVDAYEEVYRTLCRTG